MSGFFKTTFSNNEPIEIDKTRTGFKKRLCCKAMQEYSSFNKDIATVHVRTCFVEQWVHPHHHFYLLDAILVPNFECYAIHDFDNDF